MTDRHIGLAPDPTVFRTVLGHFGTGVTIVTAMQDGEPVGMACNAFASVSLDPPLVMFCAAKSSSTYPRIQAAGHYCVNILREDAEEMCRSFATRGADRFAGVGYHVGASGAPVLEASLAYIDCDIDAEHDAGDHTIVVGRVREMGHGEGKPLMFFRGGYGRYDV